MRRMISSCCFWCSFLCSLPSMPDGQARKRRRTTTISLHGQSLPQREEISFGMETTLLKSPSRPADSNAWWCWSLDWTVECCQCLTVRLWLRLCDLTIGLLSNLSSRLPFRFVCSIFFSIRCPGTGLWDWQSDSRC